jgi:hypothetical protein
MTIAYVAQTRDHLLMLDADGVCIHVHRRSQDGASGAVASEGATHCLGAQYVAALDPSQPGLLAHSPTLGAPMLFAKVGASGKISIVRTGPLERFDTEAGDDCERPTEPILERRGGERRRGEASVRYIPRTRLDDEEPTLQFAPCVPTRRSAPPPPPPPALRSVRSGRALAS